VPHCKEQDANLAYLGEKEHISNGKGTVLKLKQIMWKRNIKWLKMNSYPQFNVSHQKYEPQKTEIQGCSSMIL
jgi:hypothetical protein